ncbi:MAG: TOBE domain-containing protein [Halobacteriaceae archaeon]
MDPGFDAHLQVGDLTFDRDDANLLRAIDEHQSLNAATNALGRSYSRAHSRVTTLESAAGELVERQRGGANGGGSTLTENARELLARFTRLQAALDGTASTDEIVLDGTVVERRGELVTVDTRVGDVRAIQLDEADEVQIAFRSDAVTLHPPDTAPPAGGTSARNRFEGEVDTISTNEAVARVTVDVDGELQLSVMITRQSLETLDLQQGSEVIATFKATATRATSR